MKPTLQQQRVIDSDEHDILVEAGAGSGKTKTMVDRYVRLLRDGKPPREGEDGTEDRTPLEPREILAFTFTDKAAGELRERVRKARRQLAAEIPGTAGEGGPREISMSEAWVGTFHAICLRILKAYPIESGVDPGFGVIDDVAAETARNEALTEALERFRKEDPEPGSRDQMIGAYREPEVRSTVRAAWDEMRSRGIASPRLPDFEPTMFPGEAIEWLRNEAVELAESDLHASPKKKVRAVRDYLEETGAESVTFAGLAPLAFESSVDGVQDFQKRLNGAVLDLVASEMGGDRIREYFSRLIELYGECYAARKAERAVLDYEDLQLLTLQLLRRKRGIRDAYRERFREIMVDEFQDTNRLQLSLIETLRGKDTALVTVGDEMQSIYGFRHADVELFRARRTQEDVTVFGLTENFRSRPAVIDAVNEIGRRLDDQVASKRHRDENDKRHLFQELTCDESGSGDQSASATLILTDREEWKKRDLGELAPAVPASANVGKEVDHYNEAEALELAHHLRGIVERGEARQGEIAILLRARTRADLYIAALRQVGLTPYLVGGAGFWSTRESTEVRSLLSVIANPLDDESLLAALVSPACGLSTDALWLLKKAGPKYSPLWPTLSSLNGGERPEGTDEGWLEELPDPDLERARRFVALIERLRESLATTPLDELVEEAVTVTGYDLANLMRDSSRNGLANIRRLGSLAHEYELSRGRDLRGFLNWARLSDELDSEAPVATREEGSDVVRIMTIHAAKGLEFKVTCVPDCGRRNTSRQDTSLVLGRSPDPRDTLDDSDQLDFKLGLKLRTVNDGEFKLYDWDDLAEAARLANEDEELRLFHVALTRAEDHLVVSGVQPAKLPGGISESLPMIDRIEVAFGLDPENPEKWSDTLPTGGDPIRDRPGLPIHVVHNESSDERAERLRGGEEPLEAGRPVRDGSPPLKRPRPAVVPGIPLSFSALDQFRECPTRFYATRILKLIEPDKAAAGSLNRLDELSLGPATGDPEREALNLRDHGTRFGSAVHELLEFLGRSRWPEPTRQQVETTLRKHGLDPAEEADRASRLIAGFVESELGKQVRGGDSRFEVPLLMRIGELTIRGFIDVLVESDPPLVLDYKTNALGNETPAGKMDDYVQQRNLYSLAVARSRGLDLIEAAFVFLERPDEPVVETIDAAGLAAAEKALEESLVDFSEARFFGGPGAAVQPCGDCWACDTLTAQRARAA